MLQSTGHYKTNDVKISKARNKWNKWARGTGNSINLCFQSAEVSHNQRIMPKIQLYESNSNGYNWKIENLNHTNQCFINVKISN